MGGDQFLILVCGWGMYLGEVFTRQLPTRAAVRRAGLPLLAVERTVQARVILWPRAAIMAGQAEAAKSAVLFG